MKFRFTPIILIPLLAGVIFAGCDVTRKYTKDLHDRKRQIECLIEPSLPGCYPVISGGAEPPEK